MATKEKTVKEKKSVVVPKSAAQLQKIRLNKLMSNPEKPVAIPDRREEKLPRVFNPPEFIRNIWGSSAGAGSGDFHVYRGVRRREYARQKFLDQQEMKDKLDIEHQEKMEINRKAAEERTAKKRAKRQRKKMNKKMKKMEKGKPKETNLKESSENDDEESENEEEDEVTSQSQNNVKENQGDMRRNAENENEGRRDINNERLQNNSNVSSNNDSEDTDDQDDISRQREIEKKVRMMSRPEDVEENGTSEEETES